MAEPKPLASLSGSLLARKGAAKPAMRRQGAGGLTSITSHHDDLGWDDMGYDVDPSQTDEQVDHQRIDLTPMLTPIHHAREAAERTDHHEDHAVPEVVRQQESLARSFDAPEPEAENAPAMARTEMTDPVMTGPVMTGPVMNGKATVDLSMPVPPAAKPVAELVAKANTTTATRGRKPRAQASTKGKAAFTLRIDPERHLRLRLASALTRRSAQVILTDALDKYLKTLPEVDALAHQLPNS